MYIIPSLGRFLQHNQNAAQECILLLRGCYFRFFLLATTATCIDPPLVAFVVFSFFFFFAYLAPGAVVFSPLWFALGSLKILDSFDSMSFCEPGELHKNFDIAIFSFSFARQKNNAFRGLLFQYRQRANSQSPCTVVFSNSNEREESWRGYEPTRVRSGCGAVRATSGASTEVDVVRGVAPSSSNIISLSLCRRRDRGTGLSIAHQRYPSGGSGKPQGMSEEFIQPKNC